MSNASSGVAVYSQQDASMPISALQLNKLRTSNASQTGGSTCSTTGGNADVTPATPETFRARRMSQLSLSPTSPDAERNRAWQLGPPLNLAPGTNSVGRSTTPLPSQSHDGSPATTSSPLGQPHSPSWCAARAGTAFGPAATAGVISAAGPLALPVITTAPRARRGSVSSLADAPELLRAAQTAPSSFTSNASGGSPYQQPRHHGPRSFGSAWADGRDASAGGAQQQLQRATHSDAYQRVADALLSEPGFLQASTLTASRAGRAGDHSVASSASDTLGPRAPHSPGMSAHARRLSAMMGDFGDGGISGAPVVPFVPAALQAKRPTSPSSSRRSSGVMTSVSASQLGRRSAVEVIDVEGGDMEQVNVLTNTMRGAMATGHLHGMSTAFLSTQAHSSAGLPTIDKPSTAPGGVRQQALYNGHLQRVLYTDAAVLSGGGTGGGGVIVSPVQYGAAPITYGVPLRADDDGRHEKESFGMRKMIGGFTKRLKKDLVERKLAFKKLLR